jgi:VanZ family protein
VQRARNFVFYWLPILVWMSLIFTASGDSASFQHSSRIIGPILHWLLPNLSAAQVDTAVTLVRKCAHLTEFCFFACLFWRALRKPFRGDTRPWSWPDAGDALLGAMFYATTDEFHQTFVPTREGCVRDVIIDSTGAALGLLALWLIGRWRKYW